MQSLLLSQSVFTVGVFLTTATGGTGGEDWQGPRRWARGEARTVGSTRLERRPPAAGSERAIRVTATSCQVP